MDGSILKLNTRVTQRRAGTLLTTLVVAAGTTGSAYSASPQPPGWKTSTPMKMTVQPPAPAAKSNKPSPPTLPLNFEFPKLPEVPKTAEMVDKVIKLEDEGEKHFQRREFERAITKWQEAYGLSLEMSYSEGEGRALSNMCRLYFERGQFVKAKELGENALELLFTTADKKALARTRIALAQVYFALDNPTLAGQQLQWAIDSFSSVDKDNALDAAKIMELGATLATTRRLYGDAIKFHQVAGSLYGQSGDHFREVNKRIEVAAMMLNLGWFTAGQEEAVKAVEQARTVNDPDLLAAALASLGGCQFNLSEYANACKSYDEALKIGSKATNELARANLDANYGTALAAVGDRDQARIYLDRALAYHKEKGSPEVTARLCNIVATVEALDGNYGKATSLLKQAVELQSISKGKQERFSIMLQQNLAACESRSGSNRLAKEHLSSALAVFKKFNDPKLEGRTSSAVAEVCWNLKDPQQAELFARQGIGISEKINDDAALWRDYTILAEVQLSQQLLPQARESLLSALSYFRSPQAGAFPSPERLEYPSSREDLGHKLVELLASQGLLEQSLLAAEQLKEESFINEWHRRGGEVKPGDRDVYNDLVLQRSHLHAAEESDTPTKGLKEWQNWLSRFRQLASENRSLARLIAPVPMSVGDIIKEAQRDHAVVLDYLVGPRSTTVFTIDTLGKLSAFTLPHGRQQLTPQIASLIAASNRNDSASRQSEKRILTLLYSELLPDEVASVLPTNPDQTVVIIPDGMLFNLPFAALLNAQGKYLVENHTLTMAPSMGVFLDSPPRYSHDLSVVVASGPASQGGRDETSAITSVLEPDQVVRLAGKDSEIANFEEQAKGKAVVHFSTSVSFLDTHPMRAVLPMFSDKESKRVTADRLFELNLPNDLVVLSGTSVNAKDSQGNAVKVFSRGLNYAGVRNVLMSLWVEPDPQRTAELMEFYRSNQKGLNQAQSLRKAQMIAMSKDPSPRTWAAFQLIGRGH